MSESKSNKPSAADLDAHADEQRVREATDARSSRFYCGPSSGTCAFCYIHPSLPSLPVAQEDAFADYWAENGDELNDMLDSEDRARTIWLACAAHMVREGR